MNELGKRLRELRENKNMSQVKLAKILGKSQVAISKYENGSRQLDYEMLKRYAKFFNVSTDYLIGRVDHPDEICLEANNFSDILKLLSGTNSTIVFPTDNCSDKITPLDKRAALETELKKITYNDLLGRLQACKDEGIRQQNKFLASYFPMELKNKNASLYDFFKYLESDSKALDTLIKNSTRDRNGELVIEKANEKPFGKTEGQNITFDDFSYALLDESKELTEENKDKLLEMAKFFKQQQDKEKSKG